MVSLPKRQVGRNLTTSEAQLLQPIKKLLSKGWEGGEAPLGHHLLDEIVRAKKNDLLREHANKNKEEAMAVVGFVTTSRTLQDLVVAHARRA
ncbi:hypothetical protein HU200_065301 [Digitaria exilis]|uniref:Uncharacterized protein n=1 Tax=Digitaria exilis TaxID=1010633 RepID=A0A835DY12_9POAL|nr:hypothetical protein HU200_065301 [Digitaria exilis]